ncbi:DUF438 domain-containing protein [uncultured Anaerococcus sp.]|uniref:DUF438 domain-containing protein n=1 Tax=uncultured Anaerococcus sp. TaxID=293428 RepID=UPI0026313681|nr:DUF438 domain-containing protein [uncultured Anaerococcus sp.]
MKIDINENIGKLIKSNKTIKNDLIKIGFVALNNPIMINKMAYKISVKRGAKLLGIEDVGLKLEKLGYEITDSSLNSEVLKRQELIKSYINRLSNGEDINIVKRDFKENFDGVSSSEIMDAEESLLEEGMDKKEVKKLCDVHSALFHGMTTNELVKKEYNKEYNNVVLDYFNNENNQIKELIKKIEFSISSEIPENLNNDLIIIINNHYKKKGDLIYPLLKAKYNKPGPSEVMWSVDVEIKRDIRTASKTNNLDLFKKTIKRAEEMTYKEENILIPLMEEKLSDEDYQNIYFDLGEYDDNIDQKDYSNNKTYNKIDYKDNYINFAKGRLRIDQLESMLDTLEIEITYVDENDINSYYNNYKGFKIFKRPKSSLGRQVYSCHPPQLEAKVRKIISDLKSGKRDKVVIIRDIGSSSYTITYYGVWDNNGNYKGILETVQNMDFYNEYLKKCNKL